MSESEISTAVLAIQERNVRVELDKAWETSWTRRTTICVITYLFAALWLYVIHESHIFLKAVVPVLGYLLSTLSLPMIKTRWAALRK